MKQHVFKISKHTLLVTLEVIAVCAVLILLGLGGLLWRLHTGPLDIGFAHEHIENALYDQKSNTQIKFKKAIILWPDIKSPIQLHLEGVNLFRDENNLLSINTIDLGLLSAPLLKGDIRISTIILDGPDIYVSRSLDNKFSLQLQDHESTATEEELQRQSKEKRDFTLKFLNRFSSASSANDNFRSLRTISITNANMIVKDKKLGLTWSLPPLNINFGKDERGLIITADMVLPGKNTKIDITEDSFVATKSAGNINAELMFLTADRKFHLDLNFEKLDPRFIADKFQSLGVMNTNELLIDGKLSTVLSPQKGIESLKVKLLSNNPVLQIPELYREAIKFKKAEFNIVYNHENKQILIEDTYLTLDSTHFEDMNIKLDSDIKLSSQSIQAPVTLRLDKVAQGKIKHLWPIPLEGEGAEIWFTNNIRDGSYHDVVLNVDLSLNRQHNRWIKTFQDVTAAFNFTDTTIDYRNPLLPVSTAAGKGRYESDTLYIDVDKAKLGDMDISDSNFKIENVIGDKGMATVNINLLGSLKSVLGYIKSEPISFETDAIQAESKDLKGDTDLDISIKFPTLKDLPEDQVKVAIEGTVKDMVLPNLIENLDLSGQLYNFSYKDSLVKLSGSGKLAGPSGSSDITIDWERYIESEGKDYESKIVAKTNISDDLLSDLGLDLTDWIKGTYPATINYTDFGKTATAEISGDLTQSNIFIDAFDYKKSVGEAATGSVMIKMQGDRITETQDLIIESNDLNITGGQFIFEKRKDDDYLKRGRIESFKLHETDITVDFERPYETVFKVAAQGNFLDARPFLTPNKGEGAKQDDNPQAIEVAVDVKRMRTHPARMIEFAKAYIKIDAQDHLTQLEVDAIAGEGDFYLRLKPNDDGIQTLQLEAADAGATLRAFDIHENVQGGTLIIYGQAASVEEPRIIDGTFKLRDFKAVRTPVLARLLNVISPEGLLTLGGSEGIPFSKLQADFEWDMRDKGYIYKVSDGRTSGASIGLTFDGYVDKKEDKVKVTGTIIPVSGLNKAISSIPLIGDILGGGDNGAVIAATYKISGPSKNPTVTVNPLAALTPGILRRMLFESDPNKNKDSSDDEKKERSTVNE